MTRLIRVEIRRLWLRRMTKLALLAGLIFVGLNVGQVASQAAPVDAAQAAMNEQDYRDALKQWEADGPMQVQSCLEAQKEQQKQDPSANFGCNDLAPRPEMFGWVPPPFKDLADQALRGQVVTFGFLAFLIGASFVAAEITTGALGTWLTFVPRRVQVMSSKLVAIALFLVPTMATLVAALVGGVYAVSQWRGTAGVLTTADTTALGWLSVRVLVACVVAGVVGACLGGLTRHTAAAIATALVYLVSFEGVLREWKPELARWLVQPNLDAWVQGGSTFYVQTCSTQPDGSFACTGIERFVSQADGARFGLVVLAALAVATVLVFRRRDVT